MPFCDFFVVLLFMVSACVSLICVIYVTVVGVCSGIAVSCVVCFGLAGFVWAWWHRFGFLWNDFLIDFLCG